jgi:hypothetical protein
MNDIFGGAQIWIVVRRVFGPGKVEQSLTDMVSTSEMRARIYAARNNASDKFARYEVVCG